MAARLLELVELGLNAVLLESSVELTLELTVKEELAMLDISTSLLNALELLFSVLLVAVQPLSMGNVNTAHLSVFVVLFIMVRSRLLFILCSSIGRNSLESCIKHRHSALIFGYNFLCLKLSRRLENVIKGVESH